MQPFAFRRKRHFHVYILRIPVLASSAVESRIQVLCNLIWVRCLHVISLAALLKLPFLYSYAHHVVASSHSLTRMVRNKTHTIAVDKHLKQMHILFLNVWHQCVCVLFLMNWDGLKRRIFITRIICNKKQKKSKKQTNKVWRKSKVFKCYVMGEILSQVSSTLFR